MVITRLLITVLAAAILLGGIVAAILLFDRQHAQQIAKERGENILHLEHEFLAREIQSIQSDLLFLSDQSSLCEFVSGDETRRIEIEREYIHFASRKTTYDQIRYLDNSGNEVIRVNFGDGDPKIAPEGQRQAKADRYYFQESQQLSRGDILVSRFDLNMEHRQIEQPLKPVIRFVTPVFDKAGHSQGVLVLNYLGGRLLKRLADVSSVNAGQVVLLNLDGEYLYTDKPADTWGWMRGHERNFRSHFPVAWETIGIKQAGQIILENNLFIYERVHLSMRSHTMHTQELNRRQPRQDTVASGGNALILVWKISREEMFASSTKLLRQLLLMYGGALSVVVLLGWYLAHIRALRTLQQKRIEESEERLRALSSELLNAQESERRNISRQLHDELGQQVTAISLDLKTAARQNDPARSKTLLEHAIADAEKLLANIHEIASDVRPSVLDDLGFDDAIESLVATFERRTGVTVACEIPAECGAIPPRVRDNVYRILQEALTNIAKHGNTKQAKMRIRIGEGWLRMTVCDEGAGFEFENLDGSRLGIMGMRERAELLGGDFRLTTSLGKGTTVQVDVPFRSE